MISGYLLVGGKGFMVYELCLGAALSVLLGAAWYEDCTTDRISNRLCLAGIFIGVLLNLVFAGVKGIGLSLLGVVIPVAGLWLLFLGRILGAGDIKLFAAVGSMVGLHIWKVVACACVLCALYGMFTVGRQIILKHFQFTRTHFSGFIAVGTAISMLWR